MLSAWMYVVLFPWIHPSPCGVIILCMDGFSPLCATPCASSWPKAKINQVNTLAHLAKRRIEALDRDNEEARKVSGGRGRLLSRVLQSKVSAHGREDTLILPYPVSRSGACKLAMRGYKCDISVCVHISHVVPLLLLAD